MVNKKSATISKIGLLVIALLIISIAPKQTLAYYDVDIPRHGTTILDQRSGLISLPDMSSQSPVKRYIVFGSGPLSSISSRADNVIYGWSSTHGSFADGFFDQNEISTLRLDGYNVIEDLPLEFDSVHHPGNSPFPDVSRVDNILGTNKVIQQYGYTGKGIRIGIVDTGTDFSNLDVRDSLARDKNNVPLMIDADGQGLVLTNATFLAKINSNGIIQNVTSPIPKNVTSYVYVNSKGVFLNMNNGGKGTSVQVYNSLYPKGGTPVANGTIATDYKIGNDPRHYIVSKSGMYHFGVIYESVQQGQIYRLQLVPVLVVDSKKPGLYDTIIPDMSDSYKDFLRFDSSIFPQYDFDFTDETPIKLGNGNEFLVYDKNHDGIPDYSAGTVGARVLDLYGIASKNKTMSKVAGSVVNGTLLPALDPKGNFFGIMYDYGGHGTATAAAITSEGKEGYDIYHNSTKYAIRGVAPGTKILPIKALWLGDAIYGWLWAAGFDQNNDHWKFSGDPRVNILSNSWGISTFPALQYVPGFDIQSLLLNALVVPGSLDPKYPGILVVSSSGNAGPGYGTIGSPDAASFGLTVGSATDNVFVGYGPFKGQPRFGNSTSYYGDISGFSSKGPTVIGDPKPDVMAVGEYSFTPTSVTKYIKNMTEPYSLFGGTSLAAPLVAGSAAIVMEALHDKGIAYSPSMIKNILMSTATDLNNDPFAQGSGLVNATSAVNYALGKDHVFSVYNNASYSNILGVLNSAIKEMNSTALGLDMFNLNTTIDETSWFAGRLHAGQRATATFTIENPTDEAMNIDVMPQKLDLIKTSQYNGTTVPRLQDPLIQKKGVFRPDYIPLAQVENHTNLLSYFKKTDPIPPDASLMVLDEEFPFSQFMNSSAATYASDMQISSLYLYDWNGADIKETPSYKDLSLVNRGGSWGTVQEVRISDPNLRIKHVPLIGVYPVPTRYSYWGGDTKKNSTSIDYTIAASYYKKTKWNEIWLDSNTVNVPPHSKKSISVTLVVPYNEKAGVYQGFIKFKNNSHEVNVPVSYSVLKDLQPKDLPTVIHGSDGDTIFGNGYVGGGFDMSNRYNAGDWREYQFDITDKTINSATLIISWKDTATNLSVFVVDPKGKIIQTNVPPGVLGLFKGWPSGDWLGPSTPFSEGGGFYPIKNKDAISTEVYAPVNQTGVYSLLIHTTLFGGRSVAEPITVAAKFSTILPDESVPEIKLVIPPVINSTYTVVPKITGTNIQDKKYYVDSSGPIDLNETKFPDVIKKLPEGHHHIRVVVSDTVGHTASRDYQFVIDNTAPRVTFLSPLNGSTVSGTITVGLHTEEENPLDNNWLTVMLPGRTVMDNETIRYDTSALQNGPYHIDVTAKDKAGNITHKEIMINVDNPSKVTAIGEKGDQNFITLVEILIGIVIASIISIITFKKFKILNRS